jgi:hypothetical protein
MSEERGPGSDPPAVPGPPSENGPDPLPIGSIGEIRELLRRAPGRVADLLQNLSIRDQAEIALRLPPTERLGLLLHAPKPMRLVRTLPDGDFYLTVREVGPIEAIPLVALSSAGQLTHLLDLESWRRDEFDPRRCGAWVAMLLEAGEPTLRRFLRSADDELLALLFQKWIRVRQIEVEDTPDKHGAGETESGDERGFVSPDGYHRFSPLIPEHGPAVRRLAETFLQDQPERYRDVIWTALSELPSALEESALHWCQSRLEEHGFPPWEEALSVYAPPEGTRSHPDPPSPAGADAVAAPRTALRTLGSRHLLVPALDRLRGEPRERVLHELGSLANRVLVADSADTGDPDAHRLALERAATYVAIALAARGAEGAATAVEVLTEVPLIELFREGFARPAEVQRQARSLVEHGWPSTHTAALEMLDAPIRSYVSGLLRARPLYFDATAEEPSFRDFRTMEEIEEARAAVNMAEVLGRILVDRLGLDLRSVLRGEGPFPAGAPRFSGLFLTALAWNAVHGELRCEPIPPETTARFLRTVASRRTADPEAASRAMAAFIERLERELNLGLAEVGALQAFGRACLERLAEECGGLDPGAPVDPRFVSCLLLGGSGC